MMISPASVPVIDLRLLSHSEIADLARNDPHAYDLNRLSVVVPKIDRSTFNESAGSRKQTYSRIRKPSPSPRRLSPDRGDLENELIVQHLQHLFEPDKYPRPPDTDPITPPSDRTPPQPQPRSDQNPVLALAAPPPPPPTGRTATAAAAVAVAETSRALVVVEDNKDKEVLNSKGEVVDVTGLGAREEPFADELRRRTVGMKTEEELLRFLAGLEGKWASTRKKRKFVDAAGFGDVFPRGWKVLLGMRRKEGVPSLYCRRYISPNGREFVACKEVASYMSSLVGHQNVRQQASGQDDNGSYGLDKSTPRCAAGSSQGDVTMDKPDCLAVVPISTVSGDQEKPISTGSGDQEKPSAVFNVLECHKCSLTFGDKDTLVQHIFSFHQNDSKRKKRRLGTSVGHGVIVKDGKYICQFCHKSFSERRSYNGHVGSHVRNPGSSAEAFSHKSNMRKITNQVPFAAVPISQIDVLVNKKEGTSISKSIDIDVGTSTSKLETENHEIIQNAMNDTHDISQVACTSKPGDDPIHRYDSNQDLTKSIVEIRGTSCVKFVECAGSVPPPIDTHSVSPNCLHDIPRGDTLINPVHDQINDVDRDGTESDENIDNGRVEVIKPDECSNIESPLPPDAGNCTISATQICSHDISRVDTPIKPVHVQINDIDMDGYRSVESVGNGSVKVKKSDECSNIASPLLPSSCSGSLIKFVHDPIDDIDMDGCQSAENIGNDNGKVIKADECSKITSPLLPLVTNTSLETVTTPMSKPMDRRTIEFEIKGSGSEVTVGHNSMRDIEPNKSLSTLSISLTKTNNAACGNGIDLSSVSKSIGGAAECDKIDYKSSVMVDPSNPTYTEPDSSLDALTPSLINSDSMRCPNEVKHSTCTMVSGIEKYSMEQKGESESGLISTTGNETGSNINNISPSLGNLGSMSGEASTDMNLSTLIMFPGPEKYKEQVVGSFVGNTSSKCHTPVGSGHPGLFIGTPDCTFYGDMEPVSVLEETNNELENCLETSKTEDVGDATVTDGRNSLHANMAQTSWLHSDDSFPIDFISEQEIEDGPSDAAQEQGNITGYEDLRMDAEPPMEFDFMTGPASAPLMEFDFMTYPGSMPSSQHGMSYVAQLEDVNHPSLELDWRLSLPDVVGGGCEFKQCVWCGREFYHDNLSSQLQPNMIGLICPACKENA